MPDRSFFPATSSPITVPPTSISLSSLHFQPDGSYNLDLRELLLWVGGGGRRVGRRKGGGAQNEKDSNLPPPQNHFFLPPLTSLAWKRKVSARVVMVKSQSHRFVFHLEDHRSISEPRTHNCELNPRKRDCRPTPFQGIVGDVCYTAIGEGEGEKVKGLFL